MAEASRSSKLYDKSEKKPEPKSEPAPVANEPEAAAPKSEAAPAADNPRDRHAKERAGLRKSQETERSDSHGNMRDELRKMFARHEKAFKEMLDRHEGEMGSAAAPTSADAAAAEPAPDAAAAAPAAEA